jgi:hypothetical protein
VSIVSYSPSAGHSGVLPQRDFKLVTGHRRFPPERAANWQAVSWLGCSFGKGGQSKSLSGSGLKLPHRATDFTQLDGGSPSPNVEGRGRGQRHRLARFGLQRCDKTELAKVSVRTLVRLEGADTENASLIGRGVVSC